MVQFLQVNGRAYAYEEQGQGPLVLFGHGMLFDRAMFRHQAAALQDRFRCVRFDWPGHGETVAGDGPWTADDLVADVVAMIGVLGEEDAVLVGLSQGGAVFTRAALARPEQVRALVTMDSTPSGPPPAGRQHLEELSHLARDPAKRDQFAKQVQNTMFSPATRRDRPGLVSHEIEVLWRHDPARLAAAILMPLSYRSVEQRIGELTMPTLVLWGADDAAAPPAQAEFYRQHLPRGKVQIIQEAGHSLPLECPAIVSDALSHLLSQAGERERATSA